MGPLRVGEGRGGRGRVLYPHPSKFKSNLYRQICSFDKQHLFYVPRKTSWSNYLFVDKAYQLKYEKRFHISFINVFLCTNSEHIASLSCIKCLLQ